MKELSGREPMALHPRFVDMMRYLKSVAPMGQLPGRQHIDPLDFRRVISLINLVDVERSEGEVRFRYRLVGGAQTRNAGRETTGLLLENALLPELLPRVRDNMCKVLATRQPVFDSFPMPHPDRQFIIAQRMYYPLAADGQTINMLLMLHGYDPDPAGGSGES
ncbi:MAG: hypothetical protein GEU89_18470 [Kiloniellaceae bacterium]|nr:hypothetical protein [Kiloniellaceae bacterium]